MKDLLKDEYNAFKKTYEETASQGLRLNPLKVSKDQFLTMTPFTLTEIPWVENGYFYKHKERPGKHPYHDAGLYYIQEPSAMAVVELMDPKPEEKVLDLAAAPGGKATQIAAKMENKGLLVANEIHPKRAHVLSRNIERMGIKNTVVTNESPERMAKAFPNFFDQILVDAPCSGEGMFRKNPNARVEWSLKNVKRSKVRQLEILKEADRMLKEGGQLVYSTCTFSPEENEEVIQQWVEENPHYEIQNVDVYEYFSDGRPDWLKHADEKIMRAIRIWPHEVKGEGHFIALLRKTKGKKASSLRTIRPLKNKNALKDFNTFSKEVLKKKDFPLEKAAAFGKELYIPPEHMITTRGLKILRPGWHLGTNKRNRFEPSHAFALGLNRQEVSKDWNLSSDEKTIEAYLRGETFPAEGEKGWYLITVDDYSIGWGKLSNRIMKNHYPKGLRWLGR